MDRNAVADELNVCFGKVVERGKAQYPNIGGGITVVTPYDKFRCYAHFIYPYARYENVLLTVSCGSPRTRLPGSSSFEPEFAASGDLLTFEIERGDGKTILDYAPIVLPEDDDSSEYRDMVMEYVGGICSWLEDNVDVVFHALSVPYRPDE